MSLNIYPYNQESRITSDIVRNTQHDLQNTNFSNYALTSFTSDNITSDVIYFASQSPSLIINGSWRGNGISGNNIDTDSDMLIKDARIYHDIDNTAANLLQRTYVSLPYLGKGQGDISIETQLIRGELRQDKTETSDDNSNYYICSNEKMISRVKNGDGIETNNERGGERARYISNKK